jgi:hypothetical protein
MKTTNYNSATAADATKATDGVGGGTVGVKIAGAFTGSFTVEGTMDQAGTYDPVELLPLAGGAGVSGAAVAAPGVWRVRASSLELVRVRATALSAGTPVVTLNPDEGTL